MTDGYGRDIHYLRLSVTDLCNLRCRYCMPEEGIQKHTHMENLSFEEIVEVARAASELGFRKIRITGGEPLIRRGIVELCAAIKAIGGVEELALTTNGLLLPGLAPGLRAAGVDRVNISLDTLNEAKYRSITRCGELSGALDGIRAAFAAGLLPVKLNFVLMGGVNDDEIADFVELTRRYPLEVRFIELMPIGGGEDFGELAFISASAVLERCGELRPLTAGDGGVARLYALPGARGRVGLIRPLSDHFCGECNRLRLTPDGKLKPCLHSSEEINVRGLAGQELKEAIRTAVAHKPHRHAALSGVDMSQAGRDMNQIGG